MDAGDYTPAPAPPDGTRGPQGYWRNGHFWFNCSTTPILGHEQTLHPDGRITCEPVFDESASIPRD